MERLLVAALRTSLGGLVLLIAGHVRLTRGLRREVPRYALPERYPSVTVIRPIRGLDVGAEENVRALLALDYPGELELMFILDGEDDPAWPKVQEWVARMPTRA